MRKSGKKNVYVQDKFLTWLRLMHLHIKLIRTNSSVRSNRYRIYRKGKNAKLPRAILLIMKIKRKNLQETELILVSNNNSLQQVLKCVSVYSFFFLVYQFCIKINFSARQYSLFIVFFFFGKLSK